jgi:hypothetical protein
MRMKTSVRVKKSAGAKKSAGLKKFQRFVGKIGARTITLVVIGLLGTAMLIGARQSSLPTDAAAVNARVDSVAAAQAEAKNAAASTTSATGAGTTFAAGETVPGISGAELAAALAVTAAPVTLSGCLEQSADTFRLKDTTGADAPKARSWKSGFLKKGSASVALVNAPKKLKLPDHVGQRVSVTGMLVDREMQVRSMQRVAASCS